MINAARLQNRAAFLYGDLNRILEPSVTQSLHMQANIRLGFNDSSSGAQGDNHLSLLPYIEISAAGMGESGALSGNTLVYADGYPGVHPADAIRGQRPSYKSQDAIRRAHVFICQQTKPCTNNINWHDAEHRRFEWTLSGVSKAQTWVETGSGEREI